MDGMCRFYNISGMLVDKYLHLGHPFALLPLYKLQLFTLNKFFVGY